MKEGYSHVVDLDLEKFFDKVNHDRLLWLLGTRIGDKTVLKLIGKFLRTGILKGGLINQKVKELERRGHRFVRYTDDLALFTKSRESAKCVKRSITDYSENRLHLRKSSRFIMEFF